MQTAWPNLLPVTCNLRVLARGCKVSRAPCCALADRRSPPPVRTESRALRARETRMRATPAGWENWLPYPAERAGHRAGAGDRGRGSRVLLFPLTVRVVLSYLTSAQRARPRRWRRCSRIGLAGRKE